VQGEHAAIETVLIVCTANQCRSPLAAALLRRALEDTDVVVLDAGTGEAGYPVTEGTLTAAARLELDLADHRSTTVDASLVEQADLILTMEREHVRTIVLEHPQAWAKTFTLKELVRRSEHLAPRNNGQPRHSNYFSVWKRERDGSFKVVMDVGTQTPSPVPYPTGVTRAPHANRFTGDYDDTTPPLGTADSLLNTALRSGQARAYRNRLADGVRFHRQNALPIVGQAAALKWLAAQPSYSNAEAQYAESARSGDLGYTWGTYSMASRRAVVAPGGRGAQQKLDAQVGFYLRVWVRERNGQWKVAVDVLQ